MGRPWDHFTNQEQWQEYLQKLIRENDKALYRAILLIDARQTSEEKAYGATISKNHRGFGACDAEFLTAMAFRIRNGLEITPKMKAISRNKMIHYWRQLMEISKGKQRRLMENEQQGHKESNLPVSDNSMPDDGDVSV